MKCFVRSIKILCFDGSFYYRKPPSRCIPDTLKEKTYRRHEQFMNSLAAQHSCCQHQNECEKKIFPQYNTQTVTITHRTNSSAYHTDKLIIDFLVKQIRQRLESVIDPSDYHDVFKCAQILVTELLNKEPSLCAEDVINRVIAIMNTPFCIVNTGSNIVNKNGLLTNMENSPTITTSEYYPVMPPSCSLFPF
ncbi:unnamed protein product [Rotaria sordida]|uniref:Uncharacterized protein n=1 Tax=Rotaria sordida TaxID=392033 RepID=A0A814ZST4_9BILA|nr:unnamed protein product [Rotaria sordida]CAF3652029.1 unnamed protein product [Rotaria sordida]